MMGVLWVVLFVALTGLRLGEGLPVKSTPLAYPHDSSSEAAFEGWASDGGLYAAVPALAVVFVAVGLLFGCVWCYGNKDCKLFTSNAAQLHDARRCHPPDSGFSEPANNNISEDNNNGPISLREMQNIANNNAAAYIVSENEERNRRGSVVEFEPLPGVRAADPLEHCADWFGDEDFPRNKLQYLREIGRGWFGRVVEGEIEDEGATTMVAVKILNQNASLEDKARFLDEAVVYREVDHENILVFIAKCLQGDPWVLIFELCSMDLQQYLNANRPRMAILNEEGTPLRLLCDVTAGLAYLHSRGYLYGSVSSGSVLVRDAAGCARAVLGSYAATTPQHEFAAPETRRHPPLHTAFSEVWSLGTLVWEVCAWGAPVPAHHPPPPDLPCPYRGHLYQVMQLCWNPDAEARPTAAQVLALLGHLHATHTRAPTPQDEACTSNFEERWQHLKPNSIPKVDEHIAIVHAPSTSSNFTASDQELHNTQTIQDTLSVDIDTTVSRSSSIMSDKEPLSVQIKSESLTNLHGSLEDVRNIYLLHNETAALECHQGNISLGDRRDEDNDRSDSSVDPWLKDIIAGSQDDVGYYRDVGDVIKNLDNILNSEKTSSSESSHQASPSRDNLSLDCKKDYAGQSSMVKSPGITNFQNILEMGFGNDKEDKCQEDEVDRETIGTLSHSFERYSDTASQNTLTLDTPIRDIEVFCLVEDQVETDKKVDNNKVEIEAAKAPHNTELPKQIKVECSDSKLPNLKELCVASLSSVSEIIEQSSVREDCDVLCDSKIPEIVRTDTEDVKTKSIDYTTNQNNEVISKNDTVPVTEDTKALIVKSEPIEISDSVEEINLPQSVKEIAANIVDCEILRAINIVTNMISQNELSHRHDKVLSLKTVEETSNKLCDLDSSFVAITRSSEESKNDLLQESSDSQAEVLAMQTKFTVISPIEVLRDFPKEKDKEFEEPVTETIKSIENILIDVDNMSIPTMQSPKPVQIINSNTITKSLEMNNFDMKITAVSNEIVPASLLPPETVQITNNEEYSTAENEVDKIFDTREIAKNIENTSARSDNNKVVVEEQSNDSTVYMDLINDTHSGITKHSIIDNNVKDVIKSCLDKTSDERTYSLINNESTVYLDLPSVIKETHNFLHFERIVCFQNAVSRDKICASTPNETGSSGNNTQETSVKGSETALSETKVPDYDPGISVTKLEQKSVPENLSPFDSPTKSHPTDTYDENSSIVLGPFENCTVELFKGATELVDLPKEELLAFSSNFSEINLETPSPLRDGNFLNEVPDVIHDDIKFDDITSSEVKSEKNELQSDNTDETEQSSTAKRVSPLTPPNSPGIFEASTSQKYLVDINLDPIVAPVPQMEAAPSLRPNESDSNQNSLQKEIDLNQIELQITSKLAMAENENNMNIEYSGPLTVEEFVSEDEVVLRESDALQESILAGNGGSVVELRGFSLDEECVKALRNELELKLPLAQVAAIEPAVEGEGEWAELPPPPELVVSYSGVVGGALSPIAEETRHQLCAYENDAWNMSTRTDSSESYPEPCNNSTDEVTDLPTGTGAPGGSNDNSTYTIQSEHSANETYTVQKDIQSSKEMTMSADSLNGSPYKAPKNESQSPIDDRTYNKNDNEEESNFERISQVSPLIMSPTTDTSIPVDSENVENATGVSTLSKTTLPTDAKCSKATECLSKATSIDSWCSNDTLYNVEENFDDLALDADVPLEFEQEKDDKSESTDTLTHDDEKELSHCSTYIVHDSKSDACESFSPDSITANDNFTSTKVKTEETGVTPSIITHSEMIDSTKNTQTKDLAYGTLPSYSNYSTMIASALDESWKLPHPELVRRSPVGGDADLTPPKAIEDKKKEFFENVSPLINTEPCIKKMDSVELSCFQDDLMDSQNKSGRCEDQRLIDDIKHSPKDNYRNNMTPSVTSTPLTDNVADANDYEPTPIALPGLINESPDNVISNVPNFLSFQQSIEIRPQDMSTNASIERVNTNQDTNLLLEGETTSLSRISNRDSPAAIENALSYTDFENSVALKPQEVHSNEGVSNQDTDLLLEGESKTSSRISNLKSASVTEHSPTYSDFENSAVIKPQEVISKELSCQSLESAMSSGDFRQFASSVINRPQDLSSLIDASSLLLKSEIRSSELRTDSSTNSNVQQASQSVSQETSNDVQTPTISPPNLTNLTESHKLDNINETFNMFVTDLDVEDETEQPHSIIITEIPRDVSIIALSKKLTEIQNEASNDSSKVTNDSHASVNLIDLNHTFDSQVNTYQTIEGSIKDHPRKNLKQPTLNGIDLGKNIKHIENHLLNDETTELTKSFQPNSIIDLSSADNILIDISCSSPPDLFLNDTDIQVSENSENFATVNFINETFELLQESNVDDIEKNDTNGEIKDESKSSQHEEKPAENRELEGSPVKDQVTANSEQLLQNEGREINGTMEEDVRITLVTENFLLNEKKFCQLDSYLPLLSDIRFTGPATEIMSTSFSNDSPTEPTWPGEQDINRDTANEIMKEWDSDSDTHSSNSSSGEFIWKDGDGHETALVPSTHFQHQRGSGSQASAPEGERGAQGSASEGSGDSGSGSEGDEVEFVPSSWDCRAAPSKSSLRSLEQAPPDGKKRVVFKRQKYHCVYEYPREAAATGAASPACAPDLSTYCEWDLTSAEEAELGYGQLFGAPSALDMYPLRAGVAFGADYDEDFFISSSARPFESLGIMSTTSQFFPGMHIKPSALLERDLPEDLLEDFPPPPSPLPATTLTQTRTPSLDFTTPDSGVEDITPGSTSTDEDFKTKKLSESDVHCWRLVDSGSSSESVSPSSPGGEALGGLRHTRDKLKLDLPPSPHIPSPRHNRVFNFVLDKPKRRSTDESQPEAGTTPLVMTDETPIITTPLPLQKDCEEVSLTEPTFSTFGKCNQKNTDPKQKMILTDDVEEEPTEEVKQESPSKAVEAVKGEGTVLDSGDEDSGIESSSKATLERNKTPNVS